MSDPESATPREDANIRFNAQGTGRPWGLAVVILALAGAGLVLLSTARYGIGSDSWDSVIFLDVARNLVSGKGFVFHDGSPLVLWPPLYSMLLALIGFATRLEPAVFAHLVNAVLFALVICLSARLFQTGSRQTTIYSVLGVCAVLLSIPLSGVYAMAWSECLFIPLVLLYLVFAQRYWDSGGMLSLAVMTISTALACLTRYIGVVLVPAGVLTIILATRVSFKTRFTHAFAFAVLSPVPLGLWLVRNYRLTGTLFGPKPPSTFTLVDNVIHSARTMLLWYVPGHGTKLIVLAGIAGAVAAVASSRTVRSRLLNSTRIILRHDAPSILLLGAYVLGQSASAAMSAHAGTNSRYLSPAYIPATLILLKLAYHLLGPTRPTANAVAGRVPAVLLALWLCFPLRDVAMSTAVRFKDGAGGFSTRTWRESETVAYAEQMLSTNDGVHVYSNVAEGLWALAGVNATEVPGKTQYNSTLSVNKLDDLIGRWPPDGEGYLVWFKNKDRPWLFSIAELEEIANVVEVAHLGDGSIYRVSARQTTAPDSSQWRGLPSPPLKSPPDESK